MSRLVFANSLQSSPTPSPCGAVPSPSAPSSAANQVALVRKIPRLVTVPITASRMPSEARRAPASSPTKRPTWFGNRSTPAVSFAAGWMHCGTHAKLGPTASWQIWQPPRRMLKKGAPSEPPKRNRPGSRNALRTTSHPGPGFRSTGNGGAAAGFTAGRTSTGTTAERRYHGSCRARTALLLRRRGPVSWPSRQDIRKRTGTSTSGAGLLSLRKMRKRILPARSRSADGTVFPHTWSPADDG